MAYRIAPASSDERVALERTSAGRWTIGVIGIVAGLSLTAVGATGPNLAVIGAGCVCGFGGLLVAGFVTGPAAFVFDRRLGCVLVKQTAGLPDEQAVKLPYAAIAGLRVVEVESTSNDSHPSVRYEMRLLKHDGGFWTLFSHRREAVAQDVRDRLAAAFDGAIDSDIDHAAPSSGRFDVTDDGDATRIRWSKPVSKLKTFGFLGVFGGFGLLLFGLRATLSSFVYYIVAAFWALLMAALVTAVVNSIRKRGVIDISRETLRVDETGGLFRQWFEMPTADVAAVTFTFSPSSADSVLLVLTGQELDALKRGMDGDFSSVLRALPMLLSANRILPGDLSFAEQVELEQLIERHFAERTGRLAD